MKMYCFRFPVVSFGEDEDEAFENAMGRLMKDPVRAINNQEIEWDELDPKEEAPQELSRLLLSAGHVEAGVV
tara:strand:- start:11323 stop:11538 length:216 start_codon:yes stop_codon:yes gene_type:complete